MCPETCWSNFRLFIGLLEASSSSVFVLSLLQMLLPTFFRFIRFLSHRFPPFHPSPPTLWFVKQRSHTHTLILLVPEMSCHSFNGDVAVSTNSLILGVGHSYVHDFPVVFFKTAHHHWKTPPLTKIQSTYCCFPSDNLHYINYSQLNL